MSVLSTVTQVLLSIARAAPARPCVRDALLDAAAVGRCFVATAADAPAERGRAVRYDSGSSDGAGVSAAESPAKYAASEAASAAVASSSSRAKRKLAGPRPRGRESWKSVCDRTPHGASAAAGEG